jgi:hypothetical protein
LITHVHPQSTHCSTAAANFFRDVCAPDQLSLPLALVAPRASIPSARQCARTPHPEVLSRIEAASDVADRIAFLDETLHGHHLDAVLRRGAATPTATCWERKMRCYSRGKSPRGADVVYERRCAIAAVCSASSNSRGRCWFELMLASRVIIS